MSIKKTILKSFGIGKSPKTRQHKVHSTNIPSTDEAQRSHKVRMRTIRLGGLP